MLLCEILSVRFNIVVEYQWCRITLRKTLLSRILFRLESNLSIHSSFQQHLRLTHSTRRTSWREEKLRVRKRMLNVRRNMSCRMYTYMPNGARGRGKIALFWRPKGALCCRPPPPFYSASHSSRPTEGNNCSHIFFPCLSDNNWYCMDWK